MVVLATKLQIVSLANVPKEATVSMELDTMEPGLSRSIAMSRWILNNTAML
jgi:hypothetical protein